MSTPSAEELMEEAQSGAFEHIGENFVRMDFDAALRQLATRLADALRRVEELVAMTHICAECGGNDSENAALRADKERLDWLENHDTAWQWRVDRDGEIDRVARNGHGTLRAALDAARGVK